MAGTYSHTTQQQLVDQLAQDLGDSSKTHFIDDELQRVVTETRRLWNLLTAYDRTSISFTTTPGTAWYDLTDIAPSQLGWSVRDVEQLTAIQYRLYETVSPNTGAGGTEQFAFTELVRALQQARDRYLADTECEITRNAEVFITGGGTGLVDLGDDVIRVVRASWRTPAGTRHQLRGPSDASLLSAAVPNWRTSSRSGIPTKWDTASLPNLVLRLDPVPAADGYLELFTVSTGPALIPTANTNVGTLLSIPDDLSPAAGWSALSHLLAKHGIGRDATRVEFCDRMYAIYAETGSALPVVLDVQINGNSIRTSVVRQLDANRYGWEGRTRDKPKVAALLGDWMALCPVPDDTYSVGVDIVRRSIAAAPSDYFQIGREQITAILAWAKQLALFKVGGVPLSVAQRSSDLFVGQARRYNESRIADSQYLIEMLSLGSETTASIPRDQQQPADVADRRDTASTRSTRDQSIGYQRQRRAIGGK